MRQNQNNFQFSRSTADFLFLSHDSTVACNQQTLLTFTFIHFGKPQNHKGKKNPCYCTGQKFHLQLVIGQSCSFVTCEKNYPTYQNLCSLLQILFVVVVVVVVKLAWGKSQYVYDKQIYLYTYFKKFGPGKTSTVFKYITKISHSWLPVRDTTIICVWS